MTRARVLEILQNIHFDDNHKELPLKESEQYCAFRSSKNVES